MANCILKNGLNITVIDVVKGFFHYFIITNQNEMIPFESISQFDENGDPSVFFFKSVFDEWLNSNQVGLKNGSLSSIAA